MSGLPYEVSAEALHPSKVAFVRREDFLRFVNRFPEVYQAVTRQLNVQYSRACEQLRTVGLSTSANEKVARLFLDWSSEEAQTSEGAQIKMALTHEQIAECVGSTRETITRTLSEFKNKHLVTFKGATVTIPSRSALQAVCGD
jgi:CRP/FNR family transcriptional regulator